MRGLLRRGAAAGLAVAIMWTSALFGAPVASAAPGKFPGADAAISTETSSSNPDAPESTPGAPTNSTSYPLSGEDFSLTVSPTRLAILSDQLAAAHQFLVINQGQSPLDVVVQKRNFVGSPDGSLTFQDEAPWSASEWVTVTPTDFRVEPGTAQTITVTVDVPVEPETGDHQVALVFLVPSGETDANIKINRGVATPIYLTVPGPIDNSATIGNLVVPGFATGGPIDINATVTNTGTVHRDFRDGAPLTVDTAGDAAPFPDFTVIRGSVRDISTTWEPPLMCICHPSITFVNADGTVQTVTARVIVFPLHLLIIAMGVLALIALLVYVRKRKPAPRHGIETGRSDDT